LSYSPTRIYCSFDAVVWEAAPCGIVCEKAVKEAARAVAAADFSDASSLPSALR